MKSDEDDDGREDDLANLPIKTQRYYLMMSSQERRGERRIRNATDCIIKDVEASGGFFLCTSGEEGGDCYIFEGPTKRMLSMSSAYANEDLSHFFRRDYGVSEHNQNYFRQVVSHLRSHAREYGKHPVLHRFAYFDRQTQTLYLSHYDGDVLVIDGSGEIGLTKNGDPVFFLDDDRGKPVELRRDWIKSDGSLLRVLTGLKYLPTTTGGLTPEKQKLLLTSWILAQPFYELLPTRPLFIFEGEKGSGKSSAVKMLQYLLWGFINPLGIKKSDEKDFLLKLVKQPIALLDNIDTMHGFEWMQDILASYCTGGKEIRRRLYTDTGEILINPRALINVSTRNPAAFRRDDVADRSIVIRMMSVKESPEFRREGEIFDELERERGKLYGEWLYLLDRVVAAIRAPKAQRPVTHRLADFEYLTHIIGDALSWDHDEITEAFRSTTAESEEMSIEEDPLVTCIEGWLVEDPRRRGVWYTANQLVTHLAVFAEVKGIRWTYRDARAVSSRLKHINTAVKRRFGFETRHSPEVNARVYLFPLTAATPPIELN